MKDYEMSIKESKEIKEIMKKMQEDEIKEFEEILKKLQEYTNKHENNFSYYSINEYGPDVNNYLPSTQAFNQEYEAR